MRPPTKGKTMFTSVSRARTASKIRNLTLTEEQRRERFIILATNENDGKAPSQSFINELTFGGDGPLAKHANIIRAKFNQK